MTKEKTAPLQPELQTVEELQKQMKTAGAVHAGAMTKAGWSPGKRVTAREYEDAVATFLLGTRPRRKG